ncbi:MAG: type II toxin-antitoxin system prevent-host-death family antitoxin [Chthoniobacter sp.]|nr:type II toxin-antitoxin system prevent-host-death family antitoxin [Chthoniobacter sp.]
MKKKPAPLYRKKSLRDVTTRDHIGGVKASATTTLRGTDDETEPSVVRELTELPGVGHTISVRAAKAHLSGLLEEVAAGREVVITSDGVPKARLVPMNHHRERKVFTGTWEHLASMPKWNGGPTAEELIREDRDSRG